MSWDHYNLIVTESLNHSLFDYRTSTRDWVSLTCGPTYEFIGMHTLKGKALPWNPLRYYYSWIDAITTKSGTKSSLSLHPIPRSIGFAPWRNWRYLLNYRSHLWGSSLLHFFLLWRWWTFLLSMSLVICSDGRWCVHFSGFSFQGTYEKNVGSVFALAYD